MRYSSVGESWTGKAWNFQGSHIRVRSCVPDSFLHCDVCRVVDLVLGEMNFAAVSLHQESVAASFGVLCTTTCIVDIGDQQISYSCIESGLSFPRSRVRLPYGAVDIARSMCWLLQSLEGFPSPVGSWDPANGPPFTASSCRTLLQLTAFSLRKSQSLLKESLFPVSSPSSDLSFSSSSAGHNSIMNDFRLAFPADIPVIVASGLFFPDIFDHFSLFGFLARPYS